MKRNFFIPCRCESHFRTEKLLNDFNISAIVNCTHNISNFHEGKFDYYSFPIGKWKQHCPEENDTTRLWTFIKGYLTFLEENLSKGQNKQNITSYYNINSQVVMYWFTVWQGRTGTSFYLMHYTDKLENVCGNVATHFYWI